MKGAVRGCRAGAELLPYGLAALVALVGTRSWASSPAGAVAVGDARGTQEAVAAVVEVEEQVYSYEPADNGAGPMWSFGSSCVARVGKDVFISGLQMLPGVPPLNNVRWQLFHRGDDGWHTVAQGKGRTREPCPLACFQARPERTRRDGSLFLSDNPTLTDPGQRNGPARPEVLAFSASHPRAPPQVLLPVWQGEPEFTEHSYRSFAADAKSKELILFQNVGEERVVWSFRDRHGAWSAQGALEWPWGAEYPTPQPIRVCYPTVALKDRKVYFCGVSDIIEPYPEWRAHKKQLTGRDWDYDFRRLFFTWSDDIAKGAFHPWVEIASRDKTCGWIMPCDLWVAPDGSAHLLWTERAIDERLRERFFPDAKQSDALMYAVVREGKVVHRRAIEIAEEGRSTIRPARGRFQVTEDGKLLVLYYVSGKSTDGQPVSENRIVELLPDQTQSAPQPVGLRRPFTSFYTATWRAGSAPSNLIDIYGTRAGEENTLSYARIRLR